MGHIARLLGLLGGHSAFEPTDGCVLWFAARKLAGYADGDALAVAIPDLSQAGNTITPVNSPAFQSGAADLINNHPVVRTVVADTSYFTSHGVSTIATGTDQPFYINWVSKLAAVDANQVLWGFGRSTSSTPQTQFITAGSAVWTVGRRDDAAASLSGNRGTKDLNWHLHTFWFDGTTARLYDGGVQQGTDLALDVGAITLDRFTIGAIVKTVASGYCGMDLAEFIVHSGTLTAGYMNQIGSWLGKLYALSWTNISF
ncbi:MAG: hypothetical protein EHM39_10725 [Chloroflexi bacterium]|nr:MAG: hypothetical protein EHM39_10725 [Chloroflexota bacterium]